MVGDLRPVMAFVVFALASAGFAHALTGPATSPKAEAALQRAIVAAERRYVKNSLPTMENGSRWNPVGAMSRDSELQMAPVFLLRELSSADPALVFRVPAFPYSWRRTLKPPVMVSSHGAYQLLCRSVRGIHLARGMVCHFNFYVGHCRLLGFYYPELVDWHGVLGRHHGEAYAAWHEPCLAVPFQFYIAAQDRTDGVEWGVHGVSGYFNNGRMPPSVTASKYSGFGPSRGSLISDYVKGFWPVVLKKVNLKIGRSREHAGIGLSVRGPVNWPGDADRVEDFLFSVRRLREIRIQQPAIGIVTPLGSTIVTANADGLSKTVMFHAYGKIPYLRGGRTILIRFSRPSGGGRGCYPSSIEVMRGKSCTFLARFTKLVYCKGTVPGVWPFQFRHGIGVSQVDGRLVSLGIWPGAQAKAHPKYYSKKELAPKLSGYLVRLRIFYNAYAAAYKWDWTELATTLRCYRQLLKADHIPYVYYLYSVESLVSRMRRMVGAKQANIAVLTAKFLEPAYAHLPLQSAVRQVARLVSQYHYGFALVVLHALLQNPKITPKVQKWALQWRFQLSDLIYKIQRTPAPYRIYFLENFLLPWKSFTLTNEAVAKYYGSHLAKHDEVPIILKTKAKRPARDIPRGIKGIREVKLAIDSVEGLTEAERANLLWIAAKILLKCGGLDEAKRKIVFRQMRRYLVGQVAGGGGGREEAKLLEAFFKYDFTTFVELPDVTNAQKHAAATLFQRCFVAMRAYVDQTYTDTPKRVRAQLVAKVGESLSKLAHGACDYFNPQMLYPDSSIPSVKSLEEAFRRYPFAYLNAKAFAQTGKTIAGGNISTATKKDVISGYVWSQHTMVMQRASEILQKYFHGDDFALFTAGAGRYPSSLVKKWDALGQKRVQAAIRRQNALSNRKLYAGLLPTARQVLAGSGVKMY
jgi:hypothetical protein